jgi:rod shape-determining protein MreD
MLILAVYYALWAPWPDGALAGLALGFVVDLFSLSDPGRIGLHAFCFGAASWGIIKIRTMLVRSHPIAQVLLTMVFGAAVHMAVALYYRWAGPDRPLAASLGLALLTAAYTAILAPLLLWLLVKLHWVTGVKVGARD